MLSNITWTEFTYKFYKFQNKQVIIYNRETIYFNFLCLYRRYKCFIFIFRLFLGYQYLAIFWKKTENMMRTRCDKLWVRVVSSVKAWDKISIQYNVDMYWKKYVCYNGQSLFSYFPQKLSDYFCSFACDACYANLDSREFHAKNLKFNYFILMQTVFRYR